MPVSEILLSRRARLTANDKESNQPLHIAVTYGHIAIIKMMIKHTADMEAKGARGWRPVNHATRDGRMDIVRFLVQRGAGLNHGADPGDQPSHRGTSGNQDTTVKELLEAGGDIEARGEHDQTALHIAAEVSNTSLVNMPLDNKSDCNAWMGNETPFTLGRDRQQSRKRTFLVRAGVPQNQESKLGDHAIHFAALKRHSALIGMLLDQGAEINAYYRGKGLFPLLTAAAYGHAEGVIHLGQESRFGAAST